MSGMNNVHEGDQVYGSDNQLVGTVEELHGDGIHVDGRHIPGSAIARVVQNRVYLRGTADQVLAQGPAGPRSGRGATTEQTEGELRVPVAEERLKVERREAELGAVELRKTVTEEEQTVPVELRREEVRVERRDVADRPLEAADAETVFESGTIRVPVRGEEAVVSKEAVVTGEVVVGKEQTAERQEISDTVRKQQVEVEENYRRARSGFQQHFEQARAGSRGGAANRTFEEAEPGYRAGYFAGRDQQYRGREFDEVEPDLRRDYGSTPSSGESEGGDTWEQLREEIREGWRRARGEG